MISLDVLESLDGIQWLCSGEAVAQRFSLAQSTVSRYCKKALDLFDLEMERRQGEWELNGDQTLIKLERNVHQLARWLGHRPLRLEATYWSAPTLCQELPCDWILGRSNIVGVSRNLQLLEDGIIDCWITGLPDLPDQNHPNLTAIVLTRMPVFFTCAPNHPILKQQDIDYSDIAKYPTLALPSNSYPLVESGLKKIELWNNSVRMTRYQRERWEGKTESELVIGYGTPLSMLVSGGQLVRLPLLLPFESGDALVVRKKYKGSPRLGELLNCILSKINALAAVEPEITVIYTP